MGGHGRGACVARGNAWQGYMHGRGACVAGGKEGHACQARQSLQWMVRILLECPEIPKNNIKKNSAQSASENHPLLIHVNLLSSRFQTRQPNLLMFKHSLYLALFCQIGLIYILIVDSKG